MRRLYAYDSRPFFVAVRYVTMMLVRSQTRSGRTYTYLETSSWRPLFVITAAV